MANRHLFSSDHTSNVVLDITPSLADWDYLGFKVIALKAGQRFAHSTLQTEAALVPLAGQARVRVGDEVFEMRREGVFVDLPSVLYVPPGQAIDIEAVDDLQIALGSAPAEGKYPLRLFGSDEFKVEVRGGGGATRQVNHILTPPLPAERLILYEVYVPGGQWSGWPPHTHDGYKGSPYLEETYYFRFDREEGYAFHRNYRVDTDFDETFVVQDQDLVLVTQGFHSTSAAPGANLYFLNYLAGELLDDDRATPPYDDPRYAWIKDNWQANHMTLPTVGDITNKDK